MTIRFVEGGETLGQSVDLLTRGSIPSTTNLSWGPARYPGGKSITRWIWGSSGRGIDKYIGPASGGGLACSFAARVNEFNNGTASYSTQSKFLNGEWVLMVKTGVGAAAVHFYTSPDGLNWSFVSQLPLTVYGVFDITYDPVRQQYLVLGDSTSNQGAFGIYSAQSLNGSWAIQQVSVATGTGPNGMCFATHPTNGTVVFRTANTIFARTASDETTNFTLRFPSSGFNINAVEWVGDKFLATTASTGTLLTSVDGITWNTITGAGGNGGTSITSDNAGIVVMGANGIHYSLDGGLTFTAASPAIPTSGTMKVGYGNGTFIAVSIASSHPYCYTSPDGVVWTAHNLNAKFVLTATRAAPQFVNGKFFIMTSTPFIIAASADGINWQLSESGSLAGNTGWSSDIAGLHSPTASITAGFNVTTTLDMWARYGNAANNVGTNAIGSWNVYEASISEDGPTSYAIIHSIDGVPVSTQTITWAFMRAINYASPPLGSSVNGVWANGLLIWPSYNIGSTAQVTSDMGITWTQVDVPVGSTVRDITYNDATSTYFAVGGSSGWMATSLDGYNWTAISHGTPNITCYTVFSNANTVVIGANACIVARSADNGSTWVRSTIPLTNTTAIISAITYLNGTWIATSNSNEWAYSLDDGITWVVVDVGVPVGVASTFVHAFGAVYTVGGTLQSVVKVNVLTPNSIPTFDLNLGPADSGSSSNIAFNGKYFLLIPAISTNIFYYSEDGINWSTGTAAVNTATNAIGVDGSFFSTLTSGASSFQAIYPKLTDAPWKFSASLNGTSFTSFDDIIVTDFESPNAGPQGEVRIMLKSFDVDEQAQWSKVPSDIASNVAAATAMPTSTTDTYVEANEPGQKDIYNSTDPFTYPSGLRPLAVVAEANFERVFTNTPTVNIGIVSNGVEENGDTVPVRTPLGSNTFVQKVFEQNPDGNTSWNRSSVGTVGISVTKVS